MGIRIKKHKIKLFYRWETNRKYKKGQRQCILTARFTPFTYFWDVTTYYLKATFKSNCFKYTVEKLFKTWHAGGLRMRIEFGKSGFDTVFNRRIYRHGWYNRQFLLNVVWPRYKSKAFNPWKRRSDYIKFGLAPAKALKWKAARFKLFLDYQHHYPHRTEKQAQQAHEKVLKKKWIKLVGTRVPYKPKYRELRQVDSIPKPTKQKKGKIPKKKKRTQIDPMERMLKQTERGLYRIKTIWRHTWMNAYLQGYRNVTNHSSDSIIGRTSLDPVVSYDDLQKLWKDTKSIVHCHGSYHRKVCRI